MGEFRWLFLIAAAGLVLSVIAFRLASCQERTSISEVSIAQSKAQQDAECHDEMIGVPGRCPHPTQTLETTYHAEKVICRCPRPAASTSASGAAQ